MSKNPFRLRAGARVHVYWGVSETREAVILEVWGDPSNPTQVLVRLDRRDDEDDSSPLLLNPKALVEAA